MAGPKRSRTYPILALKQQKENFAEHRAFEQTDRRKWTYIVGWHGSRGVVAVRRPLVVQPNCDPVGTTTSLLCVTSCRIGTCGCFYDWLEGKIVGAAAVDAEFDSEVPECRTVYVRGTAVSVAVFVRGEWSTVHTIVPDALAQVNVSDETGTCGDSRAFVGCGRRGFSDVAVLVSPGGLEVDDQTGLYTELANRQRQMVRLQLCVLKCSVLCKKRKEQQKKTSAYQSVASAQSVMVTSGQAVSKTLATISVRKY